MYYLKLPAHKQRDEIAWQTLDAAAIIAVASVVVALYTRSFVIGAALFIFSLLAMIVYLLIELRLELTHAKSSHHTHKHDPYLHDSRANLFLWGTITGALAVGNFVFYFTRHGVSASEIPATAPLYREAVVLAGLTIIACMLTRTVHHRFHFSQHLELKGLGRVKHLKAYTLAFVYTLALAYVATLFTPYGANISFALLAAGIYLGLKEFQRFDRKHHRKNIISLYKELSILKTNS